MGKYFVNYRREDAGAEAARIRDRLSTIFGPANVFMDVDDLRPGQRFDQELAKALSQCNVFLAVVGARWYEFLYARAQAGGQDYVRDEIATALACNRCRHNRREFAATRRLLMRALSLLFQTMGHLN